MLSVMRCFPLVLSLALGLQTAPGRHQPVHAPAPQPEPAWYTVARGAEKVGALDYFWAIDLSASGDGWIAAADAEQDVATRMVRLEGGALRTSEYTFPGVIINRLALSADGSLGWAVGRDEAQERAALLKLEAGRWTRPSNLGLARGQSLYDVVVDAQGLNGWAVGVGLDTGEPELLRLQDGQWSSQRAALPPGVALTRIAADRNLRHVWAAGQLDDGGDAALYRLAAGRWTPVGQPLGHYVIFDLAVDAGGAGWAGLDTWDEPANSPSPTGFVRLSPDGTWGLVESPVLAASREYAFFTLDLDEQGSGWALGHRLGVGSGPPPAVIVRLSGDKIEGQQYPTGTGLAGPRNQQPVYAQPSDLAIAPNGIAWAVSFDGPVMRYGSLPPGGALPASAPPLDGQERCFSETGKCMRGAFLSYWREQGGLMRFGLPLTEEVLERLGDGRVYTVQYTERARFEYHPENRDPKYRVLLGLLGNSLAAGRESEEPFRRASRKPGAIYFPETAHNLAPPLLDYWRRSGGLPVFGYPISEAFREVNPTDGKEYLVQYFERNRLEYHPENRGTQYEVLLGLLGVQEYKRAYGRSP